MPHGHCQICLGYYSVSEFKVLPCGHGGCKSCLDHIFHPATNMGSCCLCRQEFHRSRAHRIHLEIVDSKVAILQDTIEGLERMNADVPCISVQRANKRIEKTAEQIDCDNERAESLRQAIKDFGERIAPVFMKAKKQAEEIVELQERLSRAQGRARAFDAVCESSRKKDDLINTLRSKLEQSDKDGKKAMSVTEKLTADYLALKRRNELDEEEKKRIEDENRNLRGQLERHAKASRFQKEKIRVLKHEIANLKEQTLAASQSVALDESLTTISSDDHTNENLPSSSSISQFPSSIKRVRNDSYRSSGLSQITNELHLADIDLEFDSGMPGPGFSSDWNLSSTTTKRKTASLNFPIPLDKRGRPTVSVQTGPVRLRRVP